MSAPFAMTNIPSPRLRHALAAPALVVMCGGGPLFPAHAETSATFDVSATITPGCLVDGVGSSGPAGTIGTLDFGTDSSLSTATRTASTLASQAIRLRCTPGVSLSMSVDGGDHAAAGARHLQRGADPSARIAYRVCSDAACTQPIVIGANVVTAITAVNSDDVRLPIHAELTLPGDLTPGTYNDTLTVTLSW